MAKKLVIPVFSSEAEDAAWHDRHKKEIERELIRQMKAGTVIVPRRKGMNPINLIPVYIRLPKADVEAARKLAAEKGLGYQSYIRMILREALRRKQRSGR